MRNFYCEDPEGSWINMLREESRWLREYRARTSKALRKSTKASCATAAVSDWALAQGTVDARREERNPLNASRTTWKDPDPLEFTIFWLNWNGKEYKQVTIKRQSLTAAIHAACNLMTKEKDCYGFYIAGERLKDGA